MRSCRLRRWIKPAAFAGWFALMVGVSAILLGKHLLPLPPPSTKASAAISSLRKAEANELTAVHVLYAECKCSQRIAEHLLASSRPKGTIEHVLLVGDNQDLSARLEAHGFLVQSVSPDDLSSRWGIDAVPLLVILGTDGRVRYAGGYTARKQGFAPQDLALIENAKSAPRVEALPIYGCATARELRDRLDPTGWF